MANTFRMDTNMLAFFVAITGISLVLAAKPELKLSPPNEIKEGDTLVIQCIVPGKEMWDFVKLYRKIGNQKYTISTNENIEKIIKAKDGDRYESFDYSEINKVATLNFRILDIQGKDGGTIGCQHYPSKESASELLTIHVSPKNIRFTQLKPDDIEMPVQEGEPIIFIKDQLNTLSCKVDVDGKHDGLETSVFMGNKDITSWFKQDYIEDNEDKGDGFLHRLYTRELKYTITDPKVEDNKKTITCRANMPHFPPVEVSAVLDIRYKPELDCERRVYGKVGAKNAEIACKGKMNPPPSTRVWSWGKVENRTVLTNDDEGEGYRAGMKDLGDDTYQFFLIMADVAEENFHKYKLEVANEIGSQEATVRFHQEGKPLPPEDGANSLHMCIGTLLSLLFVSLVLRL